MCWSPLSAAIASLPHVLESSWYPPVPKPILESQLLQSFSLFPMKPILAFEALLSVPIALNPSLLQLVSNEARDPMSFFHVLRPNEVARYLPSAISEYRDLAWWLMTTDLNCWPIFTSLPFSLPFFPFSPETPDTQAKMNTLRCFFPAEFETSSLWFRNKVILHLVIFFTFANALILFF